MIFHKVDVNTVDDVSYITVTQNTDFIKITNYQDNVQYVGIGYNPEFQIVNINGRDYLNAAIAYRPYASIQYKEEYMLPGNPFIPSN